MLAIGVILKRIGDNIQNTLVHPKEKNFKSNNQ